MIPNLEELSLSMRSFMDDSYEGFQEWPDTNEAAFQKWADYAGALLNKVLPVSNTQDLARTTFINTLRPGVGENNILPVIWKSFDAYAAVISSGMIAGGFQGTSPPAFNHTPTGYETHSAQIEAERLSLALIAWAKTGTAVPVSGGTPINWN